MAEKSLEIQNTLVRYNNPTLVVKHEDKKGEREVRCLLRNFGFLINFIFVHSQQDIPKSPSIGDTRKETEEILNSILPPRVWEGKTLKIK
jgi:dynein light intermediate chain, axonemal